MAATTTLDAALRQMRGGIAGNTAKAKQDPVAAAKVENLRRDFKAAKLEQAIRSAMNAAPPLTDEQVTRLRALLTPPAGGAQ